MVPLDRTTQEDVPLPPDNGDPSIDHGEGASLSATRPYAPAQITQ
jgi:hypothetical protein